METKKIIIPMPWRHVVTMYLFISEEQINVVVRQCHICRSPSNKS